jgi:hypothetical protein
MIVEPEQDLRQLYDIWLRSWETDGGKQCLDYLATITKDSVRESNKLQKFGNKDAMSRWVVNDSLNFKNF